MSRTHDTKTRALSKTDETGLSSSGVSVTAVLAKLPNWALVPTMVVLFALLLTDVAVADPLPFVDEAALLWALMSGMKVLSARRRLARESREVLSSEVEPTPAPGQPLRVPNG